VFPGLPCNGGGGLGGPGIFAINRNSTNGLDGSDVGRASTQDGEAVFGEVTFQLTDRWDMTFGARWHDQDNRSYRAMVQEAKNAGTTELRPVLLDTLFEDVNYALASPFDPNPTTQDVASFDQVTTRFATTYEFRDGLMGYIGYSEGFNSGNVGRYTEDPQNDPATGVFYPALDIIYRYDPEIIENWEIGIRADLLDRRLRANITYFDTSWNDIQLATSVFHTRIPSHPALTETSIQNAADGFAKGIETEITFAATDGLTIGANLGWLDTGFTAVLAGSGRTLATQFGGAPEETYNLFGAYTWDLTGGAMLNARLETNYTGRFWRSANPNYRPEAYGFNSDYDAGDTWKVNARVSFTPSAGNYELSVWGNNLTDEFILNSGFIDNIWGFDFAGVDAPREVGIGIRMQF
jgi:iron complex outermembrane receptor protein